MVDELDLFDDDRELPPQRIVFDNGATLLVARTLQGGMGIVHLGRLEGQEHREGMIAAKSLQSRFLLNPQVRTAYESELSTWASIGAAPFILPLVGLWRSDGRPYAISLAAVDEEGRPQSVRGLLNGSPRGLPARIALEIAACIAIGMLEASDRVPTLVHADLKPENLVLVLDLAHIVDFGIARVASVSKKDIAVLGSTAYLAPECFVPGEGWEPARDIYAFGCILYEMLAGSPPFGSDGDPAVMRVRHEKNAFVMIHPPIEGRDLAVSLADLARHCLAKNPEDRPATFEEIHDALRSFSERFAPGGLDRVWRISVDPILHQFGDAVTLHERAAGLLEVGKPAEALRILKRVPDAELSAEAALLMGSALSLSNRDEEALSYFERCLSTSPAQEIRHRCLNEKGLSLRRLKRYDEALRVFEELMGVVSHDVLDGIIANYSSTLLDAGQPQEALVRVDRLVRDDAGKPLFWALKGQIQERLGDVRGAIGSFERALSFDSEFLLARISLVDLIITHYLDLESALAHLDLTFDQGQHSPDAISRLIAVSILLNKREVVAALLEGASDAGEKVEEALLSKVQHHLKVWCAAYEEKKKEGGMRDWVQQAPEAQSRAEAEGVSDAAASRSAKLVLETALLLGEEEGAPMIACRAIGSDGVFAADYYDEIGSAGYAERFAKALRELAVHLIPMIGSLEPRRSLFRVIRCTHCQSDILSNRFEEEPLVCRFCEDRGPVVPVSPAPWVKLISDCEEAAGLKRKPLQGQTLFFVLWPHSEHDLVRAEEKLTSLGFHRIDSKSNVAAIAFTFARQNQLDVTPERTLAMRLVVMEAIETYTGTPWPVQRAIAAVRSEIGEFPSISLTMNEWQSLLSKGNGLEEVMNSILEEYGPAPSDPQELANLIDCYRHLGRMDDAARSVAFSLQISGSNHPSLAGARGRYQLEIGDFHDAAKNLAAATEDDPMDTSLRLSLIDALKRAGDQEAAERELRRAQAIGLRLGF